VQFCMITHWVGRDHAEPRVPHPCGCPKPIVIMQKCTPPPGVIMQKCTVVVLRGTGYSGNGKSPRRAMVAVARRQAVTGTRGTRPSRKANRRRSERW